MLQLELPAHRPDASMSTVARVVTMGDYLWLQHVGRDVKRRAQHVVVRPHRMHSIDAAYCYTRCGVIFVYLCVCLSVRNGDESCKNG